MPQGNAALVHIRFVHHVDPGHRRVIGFWHRRHGFFQDGPAGHGVFQFGLHLRGFEVSRNRKNEVSRVVVLLVKSNHVFARERLYRRFGAVDTGEVLVPAHQTIPFAAFDAVRPVIAAFHLLQVLALVQVQPVLLKGRPPQHLEEKLESFVHVLR